ncbi:hypothetical protein SHKM778_11610 [Streptomyces sp. KM77-8]|uniref:Uncharacterized protein n=1 Tax=Streptomyces haneummycinicus TaxID=3074435 RepID=A0AAT9HBT6_9ACTN
MGTVRARPGARPRLLERAAAVLDDHATAVADVHGAQKLLWETTRSNLDELGKTFGRT